MEEMVSQNRPLKRFSENEDINLFKGMKKYGKHAWASILNDKEFSFNKERTRDSLRVRASSLKFKRKHNI